MIHPCFRHSRQGLPLGLWSLLFTSLFMLLIFQGCGSRTPPDDELLKQARSSLRQKHYDDVITVATQIQPQSELWSQSQILAAEAATHAGDHDQAIDFYQAVIQSTESGVPAQQAAFYCAELYFHQGRLTEAESHFRLAINSKEHEAKIYQRLVMIYGLTGQRWKSAPYYFTLLKMGALSLQHMAIFGDLERPVEEPDYISTSFQKYPQDHLVRLAMAYQFVMESHPDQAMEILTPLVDEAPELLAAQSLYGELLVNREVETFLQWHRNLPVEANQEPDIWFVRGLWARRVGKPLAAARCFGETLLRRPEHRRANYQLGQVLASSDPENSSRFTELASQQFDLSRALDQVLKSKGKHEPYMQQTTQLLEQMGRYWEAGIWAQQALMTFHSSTWPREIQERIIPKLTPKSPRIIAESNLMHDFDLAQYPDYEQAFVASVTPVSVTPQQSSSEVHFQSEQNIGLDFTYYNAADLTTTGARMQEQTGGGVGVIDFDLDGWLDLYFPQGALWPTGDLKSTASDEYTNGFFRNRFGERFDAVASVSQVDHQGFGQGCAVGDVNGDGFPDLYVANIGRNCLYVNNGDGTFSDQTDSFDLSREEWTASCAIVDLNQDGHADLFDIGYLSAKDVYTRLCQNVACSPNMFDGVQDTLFVSNGEGQLEAITDFISPEKAKGLGAVFADLNQTNRLSAFISNDQVANFVYINHPSEQWPFLKLEENAFLSGMAFNENGLPMACMGIAADDVDGNGLTDIFVTNFSEETNTLYLQDVPGMFNDVTGRSGLGGPSFPYVGWGTQFIDANRDGESDLVLVNGHVGHSERWGEYEMKPQFFLNSGNVQFKELKGQQIGDFFDEKILGRSLARLDWNRDGLTDFAVSSMNSPCSLVTNRSTNVGSYLNLQLVGTESSRDAIGTKVTITTDLRSWTKELYGGDGYMVTNQRSLMFGLGNSKEIQSLSVQWPSGKQVNYEAVPLDSTLLLIEGSPEYRKLSP